MVHLCACVSVFSVGPSGRTCGCIMAECVCVRNSDACVDVWDLCPYATPFV